MIIVLLCSFTAAIYARAAFFPFSILDDSEYVSQNAHVMAGLSVDSIQWAFTTFHSSNWHPVTWLSLMLDSQIFGLYPMGYHITNVVFHVINTALIFILFRSMTGALWRSAFVAALFALHPLHVESVAWIAERKDVLSTLFWIVTLLFYTAYVKRGRLGIYALAMTAFALGLMVKPMLVTMPVVLLLLDFWPFQRLGLSSFTKTEAAEAGNVHYIGAGKLAMEKLPFLALSILSALVTVYAQSGSNSISSLKSLYFADRIGNALLSYAVYIRKMVLPFDLAIFYPLAPVDLWKACFAFFLVSGMLFLVLRKTGDYPYLTVGALWYFITLLPVIGLIQVGEQSMADRYTYIPLIGLFIMASWGAADLAARFPGLRKAVITTGVAAVVYFAVATGIQLSYWKDNIALFSHTLAVTHENFKAHYCLGMAYSSRGMSDLAAREFKEALRINPDEPFSRRSLAISLQMTGKIDEAIAEYNKSLEKYPDDFLCHNDLGMAMLQQGRFDEAIQHFSEALRLKPTFDQASSNLQFAMYQKAKARKIK
jgi:tetratricopeptide (TPR) repeat protein